tara:strand:- start:16344 stop:17861 length:1518 start_codon:yes stop_codon:yes gene_type:complete
MRYLIVFLSLAISSCQSGANNEQAHAHDELGNHIQTAEAGPSKDYTIWTDKTELFVEFPALIVGKNSRFLAHLTAMNKHKAILKGNLTVSLIRGNKGIRHKVEAPSFPGIFTPIIQPKESGVFQLVFELNTPAYSDRIIIENIVVYASTDEAKNALGNEREVVSGISFLKEQAWKTDFQTVKVTESEIYQSILSSGTWKLAPSQYRTLVANSSGIVRFSEGNLTRGAAVKKGQVLMSISSSELTDNNMDAKIERAKAEFDQMKYTYNRQKELFEAKVTPKAEFDLAEQDYKVSKTKFDALNKGYSAVGKKLFVPFSGFVSSISVGNGDFVKEGTSLVTLSNQSSNILNVQVSPKHLADLQSVHDIWFKKTSGKWSSVIQNKGKILSINKELSIQNPLLSVFAEVNESIDMPTGSVTEVQFEAGKSEKALVIPITALLEDYGKYSVIVQLSGESFELRNVNLGKRSGENVEVINGLNLNETVVSVGAYQVKMASMSGQAPAHGHAH